MFINFYFNIIFLKENLQEFALKNIDLKKSLEEN